jgi:hypothetical protein
LASVGWLGLVCMRVVLAPEGSSMAGLASGWPGGRGRDGFGGAPG